MGKALFRRVLARLEEAEAGELDPQLQEDFRIAWLTVLHASHGHREPHVAAFYGVYGLHPSKVFAAIVARRKAKLGRRYDTFFGPQLSVEEFLKLPPKKPPQSERLGERKRLPKAVGDERNLVQKQTAQVGPCAAHCFLETPEMASTALSIPQFDRSEQRKNSPPGVNFVAVLINDADLPRGPRHTLAAIYRAAGSPLAKDANHGILLWPAIKGVMIEAQIAERTARYHLRQLEQLKVIEKVYEANARIRPDYFRHTATYRLLVPNLKQRQNYARYKATLPLAMPKRSQSVKAEAAEHVSPAPAPQPIATPQPSPQKPPRKLTSRECSKLVGLVKQFKQGCTYIGAGREGMGRKLSPGDPEYQAPMNQEEAIVAACKELGAPIESAIEALKLAGWKVGNA